ncbi:MAG: TonB-dependent receptor [Candidatus Omnitrophica bacterium]|nr:TonB-dependent receptor [Candidatus Omnitrophota bacterium]
MRILSFLLIAIFTTGTAFSSEGEVELESITVTLEDTIAQEISTKNVTVIYDADEPQTSIEDSLDYQAGVDISRRGMLGIQSDLSIRGSTYEQVAISANGISLNNPQTGHHNFDFGIPSSHIERIEITRGSCPIIWGQGAMGGAVNIVTKKPLNDEADLSFLYGTDETHKASAYVSHNNDIIGLNFSAEEAASNGWRYDTDFKEFTLGSSALFKTELISSYFYAGYGEKEFGAADFYGDYDSKEWTNTLFLNWYTQLEKGPFRIKPKLYYKSHHDKYMLDVNNPDRYINHHKTGIEGIQVEAEADFERYGLLSIGADSRREDINSKRLGKDSRNKNSYLLASRNYKNESFGYDVSLRVDDYSDYDTGILPQAGIFFNIAPQIRLRSNIAKTQRPPTYTELFYDSPANKGNKNLSSEEAMNYEAGCDISLNKEEKIKARCTFFRRDSKDLIDWIKKSSSDSFYQANNRAEVKTEGVEVELDAYILQWLKLKSTYAYIDSDIKKEDDYISKYALNHPDHKVGASLDFILGFGTQTINFLYKNIKGYSSYLLIGADFSYELNKYSNIFVTLDNIFDIKYEDIRDIPLPGREIRVGTRVRF